MTGTLRDRATLVLIRDGKALLARDAGQVHFNMPGGGIEDGESPEKAAVRELLEETGMTATSTEWLFVWDSTAARHHVFRVESEGEPIDKGRRGCRAPVVGRQRSPGDGPSRQGDT